MVFTEVKLKGAFLIEIERREDLRGFFARTFCAQDFEARGLKSVVAQCSLAYNRRRGTIRGLHYQAPPADEAKLVRCTSGAIHDVIVDIRPDSPTYLQHVGVELTVENHRAIYLPDGFAHGYQTLTDGAEIAYQMSAFYTPALERGLRYDDPVLRISWPVPVTAISRKDQSWPSLSVPVGAR
jgi:dTDP-4-dehydrorhamnose 3,5-epimerase